MILKVSPRPYVVFRRVFVSLLTLILLVTSLPHSPVGAQPGHGEHVDRLGLLDTSGMSPLEVIGLDPYRGPDERRLAELSGDWHPDRPKPNGVEPVEVREHRQTRTFSEVVELPTPVASPRAGAPVVWPEPGSEVVQVPTATGGAEFTGQPVGTRAGDLPVWLAHSAATEVAAAPKVSVEMLDRATARQHGAAVVVALTPKTAVTTSSVGTLQVTLDYTGFAHAFGGDYGSRLRAVAYPPDCLDVARDCAAQIIESSNDPTSGTVTAVVPLPAAGTLLVLTADAGGPAGDWAATSLAPSGEWSHGGSSGDFTWSYALRTPDTPGALGPDLALSYSSGSVDGRITSTNNQTSWVGEGFNLESGFIERRYIGCADDMGSGANNTVKTGDLCWKSDNATISLNGVSTELVRDSSSGVWRTKDDQAWRVQRLTGAANGARNGEYWRVTTTDGTQFYFGRHTRYSGDTAATNSVLTVPVAGNHSGEPCRASAFEDSFCDQAYRWNLDYVVDPNGNTMTYFYTRESNRYGQHNNDTSAHAGRGSHVIAFRTSPSQFSRGTQPNEVYHVGSFRFAPEQVVYRGPNRFL